MSDNIVVAVRVRSLIAREEADFASLHWQISAEDTITQTDPATRRPLCAPYKFDRVFGADYSNEDVYVEVAQPIVESALHGFNGTIFAYGQTSSGKTFTMIGDKTKPGIIPLAIQNIFGSIENTPDREYLIRASYMEIYNENITDLLADRDSRGKSLNVREDTSGAVYVADLKEECINCEEGLLALMRKGNKNRHVGVTNMNERSSRSHTIFRLILESRERSEEDGGEGAVTVSHLNLVDLAGSENASQSGATGERLKEGGYINRSLFMLGRVISQLSDGEQFINFRDSKLTRILQLSLGGNAKTAIFCTVTPAAVEQTHSTLRFASRAKSIKNKPVVNEVLSDTALLKRYAKEIKNLKLSLEKERNTDKAQEVEQVREMLDEQARRNQELVARVNELKEKLVVSSHPRDYSKDCFNKKKKSRRETWAAPAAFRASRASLGPARLEPIKLDHEFLRPEIPRLNELCELPEVPSTDVTSSVMESSISSEGFGRDETSLCMDLAEQSKLGKFDISFTSPRPINVKRRRRVQFELTSPLPTGTCDAECQTEESLHPKINFLSSSFPSTPRKGGLESPTMSQTCRTPGTPAYVLRERNEELRQKLEDQQVWFTEWQKETDDLREYQKIEIDLLKESFEAKVADGSVDNAKLEEQRKDVLSLKQSLIDAELLLLDANRALSQKSQDMFILHEQLEKVNEENVRCSSFEAEVLKLREEQKELKKSLEEEESKVTQLQNDRQDFDMLMEIALQKQKQIEKDLRRSLDDAWTEIAGYEGRNKEEIKSSSQCGSALEEELFKLRAVSQKGQEAEQKIRDLEQQLEEAHLKQQATKQEMEEQNSKLKQMEALMERMTEVKSQVSCVESLESELSKAQDEVRSLRSDNIHIRETANELQIQLDKKELEGRTDEIQALQEEVHCLHEKLEAAGCGGVFAVPRPLHGNATKGEASITSVEVSRKLSETLHVLEESILVPSTPRRGSISCLDEPFLQPQDLEIIKQQLLGLQEVLVAQDQFQQKQQQKFDTLNAETTHERLYHSQVVAEVEEELVTWKLQESFFGDYIIHSWNSDQLNISKSGQLCPAHATPLSESGTFINAKEALQDVHDEIHGPTESRLETEFKENHSAVKDRCCHDTDIKIDVACMTPQLSTEIQSLPLELHQAGMNTTPSETSVLSQVSDSPTQEIKQMKWQLEHLKSENAALTAQVNQLQKNLQRSKGIDIRKEKLVYNSDEEEVCGRQIENHQDSESIYATPQQSLADELRQVGMNITLCNNTFETSVLSHLPNSSSQEIQQLKHQLELLSQENCLLHDEVKQLKTSLDQGRENYVFTGKRETEEKWNQNTCEESQNVIIKLEKELHSVLAEKNTLELEMEKLQEKLSDKMILEEEIHCNRWQIENLKQEKSVVEEELKLTQKDYEKSLEKAGVSVSDIVHIKEYFERENDQLSMGIESLPKPEIISSSKYSSDIMKKPVKTTEELEHEKKKNVALKEKLDKLREELNKLKENCVSEAGTESFLEKEKEKHIETIKILMEKLQDRTIELEEAREISLLPHSEGKKQYLLRKELEDAKDTIASLRGMLLNKRECMESQGKTHKTTAELRDMNEMVLGLNELENIFKEKALELEAEGIITANNQLDKDCLKENTVPFVELKEKQKELENAIQKIKILEKENESQHKYFEEQLANVIAVKDNELEMRIANFSEKEESFENRESEMNMIVLELGEMRKTLADKEIELQNLKTEHSNLQTMVNDLQLNLIKKCEEYSALEENSLQLQKELEHLKMEYENRIHDIKNTGTSHEEQHNGQTKDVKALSKSCEQKKLCDSGEVHKQLDNNLKGELGKTINVSGTANNTLISENLDRLIIDQKLDELEQLRVEHSSKIKDCDHLRQTIDNMKIMLTKKEEKLDFMSSEQSKEISSLIENLSKKEEVITNLEDLIKDRNEEVVCMRSAVEAKDIKIKRQESDIKKVQKALDDREKDHQESLCHIETLMSSRMHDFREEIEHSTKLYEEVCTDRKNMALVIKNHEEEIERLTSECNTLKLKLEDLERNFRCIGESLEIKEAEIVQRKNAFSLLESKHQRLQEDIDVLRLKEIDLIAQQELSSQEMGKLVGVIEKYETEMSEKDEQILLLKTEVGNNSAVFSKTFVMTQKYEDIEDKMKKFMTLEEEMIKYGRELSELQNLPNKLATAEGKLVTLQTELNGKINEHSEEITRHISEKQELGAKLLHVEKEHKNVGEKLDDIAYQLQEKTSLLEKMTAEHDCLKLEFENIQENLNNVSLSLRSTEAELSQRISILQSENTKLRELFVGKSCEGIGTQQAYQSIKQTEKHESEMIEKDEQMQSNLAKYNARILGKEQAENALFETKSKTVKVTKFEEPGKSFQETDEGIVHSYDGTEELRMKCMALEREMTKYRRDSRQLESLQEKLALSENKLMALQADSDSKHEKEQQELNSKLFQTEKELSVVLEKLYKLEQDLQEKTVALTKMEKECSQSEAEMNCMVSHYKRESLLMAKEYEALTYKLKKVETELAETKLKCVESCEDDLVPLSQFMRNHTFEENNELRKTLKSLKEELLVKHGELAKREQECAELNAEMDKMVDYYRKQGQNYGVQYTCITEKLESAEKELSETKTKLMELSRQGETVLGGFNLAACETSKQYEGSEKELESLLQEKMSLEQELAAAKLKALQLEETNEKLNKRMEDLDQSRKTLEEELKVSSDTVDSLLERLGDHDKFKLVYQEEKGALEKQIEEYQDRLKTFRQAAGDERVALERIDELKQNVTHLNRELETSKKNFEDLAAEHSKWKIEYTRLFEECEDLKVRIAKEEFLPQENKKEHEGMFLGVSALPSTVMNCSPYASNLNLTGIGRKPKTSALGKVKHGQREMCTEFPEKGRSVKSKLEVFGQSQGTVLSGEGSQRKHTGESMQELGCSDYDSMERDFNRQQKEEKVLKDMVEETGAISKTEKLSELQRKYRELQEENLTLRKAAETKATDMSASGEDSSNMRDRLVVAERENNELRLRLRALNAPAEKQVVTLRKELNLANQKVTHLRNELRRIQNTKSMDSTICEIKTSTSSHSQNSEKAQSVDESDFDYSSGSGIVLELQVLVLQNEIYNLQKEKKIVENECKTLEQHVEHYKKKALEWKENALKEKKIGEKVKKMLEVLQTENTQYKTKVEETCSHIEHQQFELGHQREIIEKLEKERREQSQKQHAENSGASMDSHKQQFHQPLKKETESVVGKGAGNKEESRTMSASNLPHLGAHNAPLPSHKRTERLPHDMLSIETQKSSTGRCPMWQSLNKENKDYSKYYLPPKTDKKNEENCKTQ
ncbi:LOW QUALITY PROTEIN: uncharacterized protein [Panulirus ornatus]|uniref:LOW QUALITY PROTEIN: uncharacterized protein n=1 Tax=Panulirus ornatus TaxID=150431 RepID=UPI003A87EA7C